MLTFNLEVSEWLSNIAAAGSWLQSVFEGLVVHIFDNWLLSGFIFTIIVLIAVCIVIDFIQDFSELSGDHIFYKMRKSAIEQQREQKRQQHLSEADKRYKERRDEQRKYYEELYRQRKTGFVSTDGPSYDIQKTIDDDNNKKIVFKKRDNPREVN